MDRFRLLGAAVGMAAALLAQAPFAGAFVTFESGPVRPLAKSPDGSLLFVCNTPDNRLEIFDISGGGMTHVSAVPVGLEPVAVAARSNSEVWVVNHLSDSVSVVDVSDPAAPRVVRSLLVGDEPRDIVFAGLAFDHAYITTAHRGQNIGFDPQLTTPGVGRADVWVFDANDLGTDFGGEEKTVITLFGDTPRPLAVSPDGQRVYAGVFFSGNQTTVLGEGMVPNGGVGSGGLPPPDTDVHGAPRPEVGLIVKYDGAQWVDELGRNWSSKVKFNLPDYDVFAIDATQDPPVQVAGTPGRFPHVGTTLFNMAVSPSGKVFVSNLEAFNEVRFEGPGVFSPTTVRGHLVESRITVIDPVAETVTPRHLNKHIDYDSPFDAAPNATNDKSLAFPLGMEFTSDGSKLYVAAFGSSKIGVYTTSEIEDDSFVPSADDHVELTGGGPAGVVLDEANSRLFVLTRFDNSVSVVNTTMNVESSHVALHNPEPPSVVEGRPFLYDARFTSSRGDQACASCHIFGDFDALAWDLGNPDDETLNNPSPFIVGPFIAKDFHPMKGPMTTQSLRGMDNHGPMHWRGDRTGGNDQANFQPNGGIFSEQRAFKKFNGAFPGLIGRSAELTEDEMQKFTDFILQVMYPPNPVRNLDNSLTPGQAAATNIYFNRQIDTLQTCNGCHIHNRNGNNLPAVARPGFFGSDGRSSFENETQVMKVAHLRNLYQKVGMFGNAPEPFVNAGDNGHKGDQVRGFGFLHDGSIDTVFRFFQATVFNPAPGNVGFLNNTERQEMESLMLAFDSNHRPIVGQQATLTPTSGVDADARVDLMIARANANECDVVAKGVLAGEERGWVYAGSGQFSSDRESEAPVSGAVLRAQADTLGQELTFTAVPKGEGLRIGVDRDEDGYRDADETDRGSDPSDAISLPCMTSEDTFVFKKAHLKESRGRLNVIADLMLDTPFTGGRLTVQAFDDDGDIFSAMLLEGSLVANKKGNVYKYKAPKNTAGVTLVVVKQSSKVPGQYRVILKTDAAWTVPAADETIATTKVSLQIIDECFEGPATKVYF
jgi:DNA-binding beta-propeller fold protein YncE